MKSLLCIVPGMAILLIAFVHFYWAFGGKKWLDIVIPKLEIPGRKNRTPGPVLTFLVALVFLAMAILVLGNVRFLPVQLIDNQWFMCVHLVIGSLFVLRAIGDFRYVGFFKKIKGTPFANHDSWLYSPLSLGIGLLVMASIFS